MNVINYNSNPDEDPFSDFCVDESMSLINQLDFIPDQRPQEKSLPEKENLPDDIPFTPTIRLIGKTTEPSAIGLCSELITLEEANATNEYELKDILQSQNESNLKEEFINSKELSSIDKPVHNANAENLSVPSNIIPELSPNILKENNSISLPGSTIGLGKFSKIKPEIEKDGVIQQEVGIDTHYIAIPTFTEEQIPKLKEVYCYDINNWNSLSTKQLESIKKTHETGLGIFIPKSGEGPILLQESMAKFVEEHKISEIKAIMPDGEEKVFKNVQFQTITGSTSEKLSLAFSQLATAIYQARLREEQEEKRNAESKYLNNIYINDNADHHQHKKPKKTIIHRYFYTIYDSVSEKAVKSTKQSNIDDDDQLTKDLNRAKKEEDNAIGRDKEKENTKKTTEKENINKTNVKSNTESLDVKKSDRENRDIKQSKTSKDEEKKQIARQRKEKIKPSDGDPDASPIDMIDDTWEKPPS